MGRGETRARGRDAVRLPFFPRPRGFRATRCAPLGFVRQAYPAWPSRPFRRAGGLRKRRNAARRMSVRANYMGFSGKGVRAAVSRQLSSGMRCVAVGSAIPPKYGAFEPWGEAGEGTKARGKFAKDRPPHFLTCDHLEARSTRHSNFNSTAKAPFDNNGRERVGIVSTQDSQTVICTHLHKSRALTTIRNSKPISTFFSLMEPSLQDKHTG